MNRSSIKFGTDGWRALVAEEFTLPNVRVVTQGVASYLKNHRAAGRPFKVIVGYDTRPLGDLFAEAVAEVFAGNGFDVLLTCGPTPTPAISFSIREFRLAGGIAVTASHNPFIYNGLKFKPYYAGPAEPEMTRWIEKRLFKEPVRQIPLKKGLETRKIRLLDLKNHYLAFLKKYVQWPFLKKAHFQMAYDSMEGAGQDLLQQLLKETPIEVIPIRDGKFPIASHHRPEPVGEHLKELSAAVRRHRCDLGLANDGDADRAGFVGPDGQFISSQETMALLLWHLLEDRGWRGLVATTISATNIMETMTFHYGVPLKRTPVGFKHIARLMRTEDVLFGGEESGGFGFRGCVPERDGLLAGLLMMEMMAMRKKNLAAILADLRKQFGYWIFRRDDLVLPRALPSEKLARWAKTLSKPCLEEAVGAKVNRIQTDDGVKVTFEDGRWFLLRPSGTEPLLRIYAEATKNSHLRSLLTAGEQIGRQLI